VNLSRCSRGIVVLVIVLWVYALFFDALPAVVAVSTLSFFLIARSILFLLALRSMVTVLDLERSVSPMFVRQGSTITVQTRVKAMVPPGFSAGISDLLPHGSVVSAGSPFGVIPGGQSSSAQLSYTMTPLVIGNHPFHGISLSLSDQFFSTSLTCHTKKAINPTITVFPLSEYALTGRDMYGEVESRAITPLPSLSVRSFRAYLPGDDLRKIDWKLSAKYDSLYIREFMGTTVYARLIIIDLPDAATPSDEKAFARMKEAVVSALTISALASREFSVILISGPNLVSSNLIKPELPWISGLMRQLTPIPRLHSLYRHDSTGTLRRRNAALAISDTQFERRLRRISTAFLSHRLPTLFELQIDRIFQSVPASTAHLFSLADHDESHLGLLSERAAVRGTDIVLHIPKECYDQRTRVKVKRCRFSSLEVF
jgi:hypothetical protein